MAIQNYLFLQSLFQEFGNCLNRSSSIQTSLLQGSIRVTSKAEPLKHFLGHQISDQSAYLKVLP